MPMYKLIEYTHNYLKTSESIQQYYRDKPALTDTGEYDNFLGNSALFKFKQKQKKKSFNRKWCTKAV